MTRLRSTPPGPPEPPVERFARRLADVLEGACEELRVEEYKPDGPLHGYLRVAEIDTGRSFTIWIGELL